MKPSEAVTLYIQLRDEKDHLKKQYTAAAGDIEAKMTKLEAAFLEMFDKNGMDSFKTDAGTVFTSSRASATIADKELFMEFVKSNEHWPMITVRANPSVIKQYNEATQELPPGINYSEERVVSVRRVS